MTKKLSIKSYRKPDNRYLPLDLVVCEGETEVDYFSELARNLHMFISANVMELILKGL